jgi:hypothetical protein
LTVKLLVTPVLLKRGAAVQIEIASYDRDAHGALGYLLHYGDGTTAGSGAVPQFCLGGAGRPARRTWRQVHRYSAVGRHLVSVSVYVNCSNEHAVATVPVVVR